MTQLIGALIHAFAGIGHSVRHFSPFARRVVAAFIDMPGRPLDAACATAGRAFAPLKPLVAATRGRSRHPASQFSRRSSAYARSEPADVTAVETIVIHFEIPDRSLPLETDQLRTAARHEGYRFLDRLVDEWATGANRFSQRGERLLIAHQDGRLAGVGGITVEPDLPGALRMRRFYVLPANRKRGIGRRLVEALLDQPRRAGTPITVNAATDLAPLFWEALGFQPDRRDGHTHILRPTDRLVIAGPAVPIIGRETPDQPEIIALLRQADERSASLYATESRHGSSASALLAAGVRFFVVRERDRALGCAGYVVRADGSAELKRLFVHPSARSRRLGRRLVETIENAAAREGITCLLLETGVKSREAIALYRSLGFDECAPFIPYGPDPLSVFMAKRLGVRSGSEH